jgi:hypothetical protein
LFIIRRRGSGFIAVAANLFVGLYGRVRNIRPALVALWLVQG